MEGEEGEEEEDERGLLNEEVVEGDQEWEEEEVGQEYQLSKEAVWGHLPLEEVV